MKVRMSDLRCRGGEFVVRRMVELGIRQLFSIPGSQVLPMWNATCGKEISLVVPSSERNAAFMGEGYGRAAGSPAVVMDTLGPGVANEAVAMWSAKCARAPVLFVCPSHPNNKHSRIAEVFQGLDHALFFRDLCKASFVADDADSLADAIDRALLQCQSEPCGPVRLDISFPLLFQRNWFPGPKPPVRPAPPPTAGMIVVAESPQEVPRRVTEAFGIPQESVLCPGIGRGGFGLPFALGAKFACPGIPVALVTEAGRLMENLDSFALANRYRVPLQLFAAQGADNPKLEEIARLFGTPLTRVAATAGLTDLIHQLRQTVSILADFPDAAAKPKRDGATPVL